MEFRVLRYFLAVAKEKSITAASQTLNLTQPTLSRQLMELEEEIGKKLFVRSNRKITLTEEGLILQKRAEEILELLEKTKSEVSIPSEEISGEIHIGCAETRGINFIAKIIAKMQKDYPQVCFRFFSGNAEEVADKLNKGLLDFGIIVGNADISKYECLNLPWRDTWGLLMPKNALLATKDSIEQKDIFHIPLIVSAQTLNGNNILSWFGNSYNKLNIVATYNLLFNASILVEEGVGYALCLDKIVSVDSLCFKPLSPTLNIELNFIWKKYQVFSKAANLFLSYIQQELDL
ncbi:MAG: LysR family transcriptional regulator [Alphaproteobacteria bacterium]|jgi:DNA-binding transcriptional LysR family regulator|nr:LysR family transcriptional regulator [Alphaproteobacteria bacterium]